MQHITLGTIPEELKTRDQWVTWRYEQRSKTGKPTKPLFNARTGKYAKSDDSTTWATFDLACKAAQQRKHDGVGFVFSPDDPYTGIDLDNCINESGAVAPWAESICDSLNSYAEISPSGKGIKIWVKGEIPSSVKTESIEMYSRERYFTVTGNHLAGMPTSIAAVNGALDKLYHSVKKPVVDTTTDKVYTAPVADDSHVRDWVDRLFEYAVDEVSRAGDGNRHNKRISQARLLGGLVPLGLATEDQIESVLYSANVPDGNHKNERKAIRAGIEYGKTARLTPPEAPQQPIYDDKGYACCPSHKARLRAWDGGGWYCPTKDDSTVKGWCVFKWKGEGYVMPTLTNSHDSSTTLKLSREDVIVAAASERGRFAPRPIIELDSVAPPQWLLRNELVRGYNFLYGPSGSGKTFYAIDLAGRVATEIGTVVYIPTEDVGGLRIRTTAWRLAHEKQLPNFHWINATREQIDLTNTRDVDDLIDALRPLAPKLTIIDTLAMAHTGDENNETYSAVNRSIQRIMAEVGTYILLVHHTGVNEGRERGGTALMGNVDIKLKVSNDDGLIRIQNEKIRNGIEPDAILMRLTSVNTGIKDDDGNDIMSAVIRAAANVTMRGAALTAQQKALLEALALEVFAEAGAKGSQLMVQITNIAPSSFYRTISTLMNKGLVRQNKKGDPFYITDKGRDELAPEYTEAPDPGYTPAGYEDDSQGDIPQQNAQVSDSQATLTDSHESNESPSTTHTNSTTPLPPPFRVGVRESCESDPKEEMEEQNTDQQIANPYSDVDLDYVRTLYANKELVCIQRHCALRSFNGIRPASVESVLEFIDPQPLFDEDG